MIKEFSQILIDKSANVMEAMKQLDNNAEKILFVVEDGHKLVGSLTDGDIRRWILKDGDLKSKVKNVCFKSTYTVKSDYNLLDVKEEIRKREIVYVPVLGKNREITEFLAWDKLFGKQIIRKTKRKLATEVVIMAGGKGTRLDPFTKILPKPLIPIGDRTILEIIIDKFSEYKIKKFHVSVNHKARIIKSYFEELKPDYEINYLYEDKPLGTIGALKQLEDYFTKSIILTNCDIIIETNYNDLLLHHKEQNNDITIIASLKHFNIPYGVCEIENGGQLLSINEKPEYNLLVNTGMYVLEPKVLKHIPKNKFFHITDLIDKIKSSHTIGIYPISENSWIDTGEWVEYRKAIDKLKI